MSTRLYPAFIILAMAGLITCGAGTSRRMIDPVDDVIFSDSVDLDTLTIIDTLRQRLIPIAIYRPAAVDTSLNVVLLSHGYNENRSGTYLRFSSLCNFLVQSGRVVVSIQHELPMDEPLAMKGDLLSARRPNWERGAANILFVMNEMKRSYPAWRMDRIDLVGHSNGGDMSLVFAATYPFLVGTVVSLDNLRMPLPRVSSPRIRSLRANDTKADPGVLPTSEEQYALGIVVEDLPTLGHSDMNDRGTVGQRSALNEAVLRLLD